MQYFNKELLGQRIQSLRKSRGITQSALSELLEYANERQLQRIERGETGCSVDKLMEVAQILNTSTDYLLFGREDNCNNKELEVILSLLVNRSPQEKKYVYQLMKVALDNLALIK